MDLIIKNGVVITGDGSTILPHAWVGIENHRIAAVSQDAVPASFQAGGVGRIIDADGRCILPGIINAHTHGCTVGPLFSSGAPALPLTDALRNADTHLSQGTTTLINACGLGTMDDVHAVASRHPVRILCGTSHFPSTFRAAQLVDGTGLNPRHLAMTAAEMLADGAVALGEIGSGATLGGGVSCYKYIPDAIERETGIRITREQATQLKNAAASGLNNSDEHDKADSLTASLAACGLAGLISPDRARTLITDIVEKPVQTSLNSFDEAAQLGAEMGVPVIFHTASVSADRIAAVARRYSKTKAAFVAGHCNHPSFSPAECVEWARKFKDLGVVVDISTLNGLRGKRADVLENAAALLVENLADTFTTDYGGGQWDGILDFIQHASGGDLKLAAKYIGMATGRVAGLFPAASAGRGYIREGMIADVVVTNRGDVGKVCTVLVDGNTAFDGGLCIRG